MKNNFTTHRMATILVMAGILVIAMATQSLAVSYGFTSLTGDSQAKYLTVDVTDLGNGKAAFNFTSSVFDASAITAIYWDFGNLAASLSDPTWTGHTDTSFEAMNGNLNLPGGTNVGFDEDYGLARTKKGGVTNGLNSGEWLNVVWTLSGIDFSDLIAALGSGEAMIGMHVQSVGPSANDSFSAVSSTPIPGAAWLLGSGLVGLVGLRRKFKA